MALDDYLIPIAIGVTGHRSIDSADQRLISAITDELTKLRDQYPHTRMALT